MRPERIVFNHRRAILTKFLHTSDWHLNHILYDQKRNEQFSAFLTYLHSLITRENVDVLLISGDVFDTTTPSNTALKQYYSFLAGLNGTCCRQVIIIAGNHDSPSLLEAPKYILEAINVKVVSRPVEEEEIVPVKNKEGAIEAVVLAVPFLRDSEIQQSTEGQSAEEKEQTLQAAIKAVYQQLTEKACKILPQGPIIAMGHLYLRGSIIGEGQDVHDYIGNLGAVNSEIFPSAIDYVALGHIHVPQVVAGATMIRYCGSPLPISFSEADQKKQVVLVTFDQGQRTIEPLQLPPFCHLKDIKGDWPIIEKKLKEITEADTWVEVIYTGEGRDLQLRDKVEQICKEKKLKLLRVSDMQQYNLLLSSEETEDLATLSPQQVFQKKLDNLQMEDNLRKVLLDHFKEIVQNLEEGKKDENP
ncbi:MAG: exonuclease SbcCD subunit D C-terminal domain-containing protein [Sphaerochaetaceae bacterium]